MIKKFKEFNEHLNIISKDEVEDQFLRIKEVLNYAVDIYNFEINMYQIDINNCYNTSFKSVNNHVVMSYTNINADLKEEINLIKKRMAIEYPMLKFIFVDNKSGSLYIWIYSDSIASRNRVKEISNNKSLFKISDYLD